MSLGWKLRRLRAMSAGEIATRAKRKVRDKLFPSHYTRLSADEAFEYFFKGDLPPQGRPPDGLFALLPIGDCALESLLSIDLFGETVTLDDPPVWNRNYRRGGEWPGGDAHHLDLRRTDIAGGVKYVWEPSRHHIFTRCAFCSHNTKDPVYAKKLGEWMDDWIEKDPVNQGIHWTSALEMAVRIIVWTWCLWLTPALAVGTRRRVLGSMAQQAAHIAENLSFGSSANNHLIGEAAALAFFAAMWPTARGATEWQEIGSRIAFREALRQLHDDGVPGEQTFGYLPFVWEFYVHMALARIPIPSEVSAHLSKSVQFVGTVMSASGYVPQVGDEDDGSILTWRVGASRYRAVADAMHHTIGTPVLEACAKEGVFEFPQGGYTVYRHVGPEAIVVFDHGPLGLGALAAHGHADALSVILTVEGFPVLVDPGIYAYHEAPEWRSYFRGTSAHNTICFEEKNQSEILGAFLWGRRASVRELDEGWEVFASPNYEARHTRMVVMQRDRLSITDAIDAPGVAHWHFHPSISVAADASDRLLFTLPNGAQMSMQFPAGARIVHGDPSRQEPGPGWYSPRFGVLVPCTTVIVDLPVGKDLKTVVNLPVHS